MPVVVNALTVDVEDYFMASAFEPAVPKGEWARLPSRVVPNTEKILDILAAARVRATFFTLGWVAERFPALLRRMAAEGHEVACHGHDHRLIYRQTPAEFRLDVRRAKAALEDAAGVPVRGYRAPSFSLVPDTRWALDVLAEEDFAYDASLLPARHARGGIPDGRRFPFRWQNGLAELPMSVFPVAGTALPFSGGGYMRLLPVPVIRWGIRACHRRGGPAVVYLHPWELDPGQPRLPAPPLDRFRHYLNLRGTEAKFRALLEGFRWDSAASVLEAALGPLEAAGASPARVAP